MEDKKMYSARIDPSLHKAVKMLSVEMDKSIVALTEEALRDLLKKYEKNNNSISMKTHTDKPKK